MTENEVTEYIFINDEDPTADIALVFGTWHSRKDSVEKTVDLYHKGMLSKAVFSGGINKYSGEVEGNAMAMEAVKLGMPEKDILIENKATNTLENVLFSLQLIEETVGLKNVNTIVGVAKTFHARRALMTMRRYVPGHIELKVATYASSHNPVTKFNWTTTTEGRKKVMIELEKIKTYLAKGDLAEL